MHRPGASTGCVDRVHRRDRVAVLTSAQDAYGDVSKALESRFGEPRRTGLIWKAQNTIDVDDETGEKLIRLVEVIEDQDDVQNVFVNFALSDALMEKLQG